MSRIAPPVATAEGLLHGWFLRGAAIDPDAEALRIGARSFSYRHLHERALALAGSLTAALGGPARRVGLLAARSEQAYAGMLAPGYAGGAVVPLNPEYPAERTRRMIAAAGLDALLVDASGAQILPELADELGSAPVIAEPTGPPLDRPLASSPDDVAYIMFTSGSTGRPKGVPILHRNVDAYMKHVHRRYPLGPQDAFAQIADLTFDMSIFDVYAAWGCGGTLVSVPPQVFAALPAFIAHHRITVWFSSPSVIALARRMRALAPGSLAGLRVSLFCGEPLLRQDAADWYEATGSPSHAPPIAGIRISRRKAASTTWCRSAPCTPGRRTSSTGRPATMLIPGSCASPGRRCSRAISTPATTKGASSSATGCAGTAPETWYTAGLTESSTIWAAATTR
jgi:non-ribosomal peptide synthetase component F